ncbi:unnamed protein product [Somion occarium]|uniref:Uncharacterized protein n=1 Tax=Somion occarium TaxID=3059160 RepID=A0ABP1DUU4_9APHY
MLFEEYESESPRVPSPWDPFLPSPPSESSSFQANGKAGIPKLVPEVEEGNVEYKLKLTQISPARFARLVTQLKWRLLEGGGQAYYELGVADTGASVIVVKEIEVPPIMVALADKISGYLDPETGEWADKMSSKRPRAALSDSGTSTTPAMTEAETETSTAESTDAEDGCQLNTPALASHLSLHQAVPSIFTHRIALNPERPTAQSSPSLLSLDDDLALFSMEPEPALSDTESKSTPDPVIPDVDLDVYLDVSVALEIASVFKPRPLRKHAHSVHAVHAVHGSSTVGHFGKRVHKPKQRKIHPWHAASHFIHPTAPVDEEETKEARARNRRTARDKRREERRKALLVAAELTVAGSPIIPVDVSMEDAESQADGLVTGLEALHVTMEDPPSNLTADETVNAVSELVSHVDEDLEEKAAEVKTATGAGNLEPRLIVEALVVRKLSIEDDFLDFGNLGGFALS